MQNKNLHIDTSSEKKMESGILSGIKKENPFQVHTGYFEELPQRITDTVSASSQKDNLAPVIIFFSFRKLAYSAGIAAIVLLAFFWLSPSIDNTQFNDTITLEQILDENPEWFENMSDYELLEALYVISDNELDFDDEYLNFDNISDDEIYDYLDDENISSDLLYNL